ncbi:MAG TPA: cysteine synthase CysM [Spirochaetia bacterium]|nr:cysteine synthase CysM [Spirochaetia bacterium]
MNIKSVEECIGETPLVGLRRIYRGPNRVACKLEGNNPAGSVKDRPALSMIVRAEASGRIKPGDTLIEATSGNTGIALAMAAAIKGYRMVLVMPENMSVERRASMRAYGAELRLTPSGAGMEAAIDLAREMERAGEGVILDQFANPDNPLAHYETTGPEIWRDTEGKITHFVASTGTTGTIMGTSRFLKEKNPKIRIVAVTPDEEGGIPGIRAWPKEYLPKIFEPARLDERRRVSKGDAEEMTRRLAREEGLFCGISSGGNVAVAAKLATELESEGVQDALIVTIICDRGDRYLSTGVFPAE